MNETSGINPTRDKKRNIRAMTVMAFGLVYAFTVCSCGNGGKNAGSAGDVLLEYGDSMLRKSEVVAKIPTGLTPADSSALFRTIVENWVEEMLLAEMAEERIDDIDEIERKVAAYRRQLIVARYLRSIREAGRRRADKESIQEYYNAHSSEMKLETPIVKGIYVKVPANSESLDDIRKWVRSATDTSIDNLEKYGLGQALQYDYFKDKWLDWQTIADQIPYRFYDPENFLAGLTGPGESMEDKHGKKDTAGNGGYFETEKGGSVYMLHITAWLPAGSEMPYEFATSRIAQTIEERETADYERRLISSLYKRARKEKKLRIISFDPALDKKK